MKASIFSNNPSTGPKMSWEDPMFYPSISGLTTFQNVKFKDFSSGCNGANNYVWMTSPVYGDILHPTDFKNITLENVGEVNKIYHHAMTTRWINPSDCVDMDCDARRKVLLTNDDGSFFGENGISAISQSEFGWGGDRKWGLNNRRIPKTLLATPSGGRLNADATYPNKGIDRHGGNCVFRSDWRMYRCKDMKYRMFVFESLDKDTEIRRLSPIALATRDGYIDLINGPQDHGWCHGYTCQERVSMFQMIVNMHRHYDLYLTSYNPQKTRLMILNAEEEDAIRLAIYYPKPQRLDIYRLGLYIRPNNAVVKNGDLSFAPYPADDPDKYLPDTRSFAAGNWFDEKKNLLYVVVKGKEPVRIVTVPIIQLRIGLSSSKALDEDEFFGPNLAKNIAAFFKIDPKKIFRMNVVSAGEGRRRRRATGSFTVEIDIGDPAPSETNNTTSTNQTSSSSNSTNTSFNDLSKTYADVVTSFQTGSLTSLLSDELNVTVEDFAAREPEPPPPEPPAHATSNTTQAMSGTLLSDFQLQQFEADLNNSIIVFAIPTVAEFETEPSYHNNEERSAFITQPAIRLVDANGDWVSNVGGSGNPWEITSRLIINEGGDAEAELIGNSVAQFKNGVATFTDLGISHNGTNYTVVFDVTKPANQTFSVTANNITAVWVKEDKVADHELECTLSGMKITFSLSDIALEEFPYEIRFKGQEDNANCSGITGSSVNNTDGKGGIFIETSYLDCGISIHQYDEYIQFNQTVEIIYGNPMNSTLVYRSFKHDTQASCFFHVNQTTELSFNVFNRISENVIESGIGEFDFDFGVYKADNTEVTGLISIGEILTFKVRLTTLADNVLLSPQNCYATRGDRTGRVTLIKDRCPNPLFTDSLQINTSPTDKKYFEWQDIAFRYHGNSNTVRFACDLLVCPVKDFANTTQQCKRCNQVSARRRREAADEVPDYPVSEVQIESPQYFIVEENEGNQPTSNKASKQFMETTNGILVATIGSTLLLIACLLIIKKSFHAPKIVSAE
ncbi:fibrocystin-L-like [Clytia hemisphaerica]|uniref:ZP domain-containing protein n=1 Tax=Clytia hemisphaerica TaxID=252671 RepID=A0A7M5WK53_9CNID